MEPDIKKTIFKWLKPVFFVAIISVAAFTTYRSAAHNKALKNESITGIINDSIDGSIDAARDPLSIFYDDPIETKEK